MIDLTLWHDFLSLVDGFGSVRVLGVEASLHVLEAFEFHEHLEGGVALVAGLGSRREGVGVGEHRVV